MFLCCERPVVFVIKNKFFTLNQNYSLQKRISSNISRATLFLKKKRPDGKRDLQTSWFQCEARQVLQEEMREKCSQGQGSESRGSEVKNFSPFSVSFTSAQKAKAEK